MSCNMGKLEKLWGQIPRKKRANSKFYNYLGLI